MILLQAVLIVAFVLVAVRFWRNPNNHSIKAWKKILGILFVVAAIFAVLFPQALNDLAHFAGVGRGADLLLYGLTLAFVFVVFDGYIQNKREQQQLVRLSRRMAIIDACNRYGIK